MAIFAAIFFVAVAVGIARRITHEAEENEEPSIALPPVSKPPPPIPARIRVVQFSIEWSCGNIDAAVRLCTSSSVARVLGPSAVKVTPVDGCIRSPLLIANIDGRGYRPYLRHPSTGNILMVCPLDPDDDLRQLKHTRPPSKWTTYSLFGRTIVVVEGDPSPAVKPGQEYIAFGLPPGREEDRVFGSVCASPFLAKRIRRFGILHSYADESMDTAAVELYGSYTIG